MAKKPAKPAARPTGPEGYAYACDEGKSFTFTQRVDVAYGAAGKFRHKANVTGQVRFDNATFGDPIVGTRKAGFWRKAAVVAPTPVPAPTPTTGQGGTPVPIPTPVPVPVPAPTGFRLRHPGCVNVTGSLLANVAVNNVEYGHVDRWWADPQGNYLPRPKTDALGWPVEDAMRSLLWTADPANAGDWLFSFTGRVADPAKCVWGEWDTRDGGKGTVVTLTNVRYDPATNRTSMDVNLRLQNANTINVGSTFRGTNGGVRDVDFRRREHRGAYLNPDAVRFYSDFAGGRGMDYFKTNQNFGWVNDGDRTPPGHAAHKREHFGGPLEVFIDFCNACGMAPYVNLPGWGTDDAIKAAVALVLQRTNPDLPVYFETHNELWNTRFKHTEGMLLKQVDAVFAAGQHAGADRGGWFYRCGARMQVRYAKLVKEVSAGQPAGRVRMLFGGNAWDPNTRLIEWAVRDDAGLAKFTDLFYAPTIAPYFINESDAAHVRTLTSPEQVAAWLAARAARAFPSQWAHWSNWAKANSEGRLVGYEGLLEQTKAGIHEMLAQLLPQTGEAVGTMMRRVIEELGFVALFFLDGVSPLYGLSPDVKRLDTPKRMKFLAAAAKYPGN